MKETRVDHVYRLYGRWVRGYGSSMDPHRCGDESEPCTKVTWEREVSPWEVIDVEKVGHDEFEG